MDLNPGSWTASASRERRARRRFPAEVCARREATWGGKASDSFFDTWLRTLQIYCENVSSAFRVMY